MRQGELHAQHFVGYGVGPQSVWQSVALEFREEHRRLSELALELAAEGVPVTLLMIQGHVVDKILDQAQRLGSELIVLASKGHSWDFHRQRMYMDREAPAFRADTELRVTCDYDTREDSEPVLPGWGTCNEMCTAVIMLAYPPGVFF